MTVNIPVMLETLKCDEGLRLCVYTDTTGHATVGYGHKCIPADNLTHGQQISQAQADWWLNDDVNYIVGALNKVLWFTALDDVRQTAIAMMAYNLGESGLEGFGKMILYLRGKNYQAAAVEMLSSLWAKQVGDRAIRLAKMVQTGAWP